MSVLAPDQALDAERRAAQAEAELRSPWAMKSVQERHVNIVAGRATFAGRAPRVYAYVHKEVPSAAAGASVRWLPASSNWR